MISDMGIMFSRMVGTLAVILIMSGIIGVSDVFSNVLVTDKKWKYVFYAAILGGMFGIYGNLSGFSLNGAVVSVRDMGPMLAGLTGGPLSGLIAGLIAGLHRLSMGGITARPCVVATCCIGFICGVLSWKHHDKITKPLFAFLLSALMEIFHLSLVLLMVRPFETALDIVRAIALPFVGVNAVGFWMMIRMINYFEKQRDLSIEKSRLQSELEVANVIQHSLLPLLNEEYPGRPDLDISAFMEAAKEVGGDFYDVFFVDPTHLAFVIGDVSGKGIPAALFMASSKIVLQNCIRDYQSLSEAAEMANNVMCARNEAEMFVTAWLGVFDLTSGQLNFVSAGHNPPVLLHDGKPEFLRVRSGLVLAGMEDMKYTEHSIQLSGNDMVYLYTDGVTEAENKDHKLFGEERLLRCFENKNNSTAAEMTETVKKSVEVFIDGNSQFDDMTMLCFKWKK